MAKMKSRNKGKKKDQHVTPTLKRTAEEASQSVAKQKKSKRRKTSSVEQIRYNVSTKIPSFAAKLSGSTTYRIDVLNDEYSVMLLEPGCRVQIWGYGAVACLGGAVEIAGYLLQADHHNNETNSPAYFDVYSPLSGPFYTLSAKSCVCNKHNDIPTLIKQFTDCVGPTKVPYKPVGFLNKVVLLWKSLNKPFVHLINQLYKRVKPLFPPFVQEGVHIEAAILKNHRLFTMQPSTTWHYTLEHEQVVEDFEKRLKDKAATLLIAGNANSGKSSLLRYIINRLLSRHKAVCYLDCDLGQTEFNAPGCVALHTVTTPLLGPPFTHQKKADSMIYTCSVSPIDNPAVYYNSLREVYDVYMSKGDDKPPLFVNTMGWFKGPGLTLLAATVCLTEPDVVIQLQTKEHFQQQPIDQEFLVTQLTHVSCLLHENLTLPKQTVEPTILPANTRRSDSSFTNKDLRAFALLSHLSEVCPSSDYNPKNLLNAIEPRTLRWCDVAIHNGPQMCPRSELLHVINASVVGLCHVGEDMILKTDDDTLPGFLKSFPIVRCFGFGIVRGINADDKLFYITSSISDEDFSKVNCLVKGIVGLPQNYYEKQKVPLTMNIPYLTQHKNVMGNKAVAKRKVHAQKASK